MKALDLITEALDEIGAHGSGEPLEDGDAYKGLRALNSMLDRWRTNNLTIFNLTRTVFAFTAAKASYLIGPSTDARPTDFVTTMRPVFIDRAGILIGTGQSQIERALDPYTKDGWEAERVKNLQSTLPRRFYYNADAAFGTLTFWPVPTDVTVLPVLYLPNPMGSVAALTTDLELPPGCEEAVRLNLAVACCRRFGRPLSVDLAQDAAAALADYKRSNLQLELMRVDPALTSPPDRFDIFTGNFPGD